MNMTADFSGSCHSILADLDDRPDYQMKMDGDENDHPYFYVKIPPPRVDTTPERQMKKLMTFWMIQLNLMKMAMPTHRNIFALFASYRSKIWQTRIGGNRSSISHKGNISRLHLMRKEP
ncbi:hypothetical protein RCL_jg19778.t2 [Rhizophagus clarus]|uniref:Uncharacterized protein n=1 Tax=Rhizophagus clarus TaxID=94130 RepID=A0A8H3MAX2_9GLOM|nr:hypothetical protein RCL_jg19778.t2 [Rhizophagus clarus]